MRPARHTERSNDPQSRPPRRFRGKPLPPPMTRRSPTGVRPPEGRGHGGPRRPDIAVPATTTTPPPPRDGQPAHAERPGLKVVEGVLELTNKGFGFLRNPLKSFQPTPGDPYVSNALVDRFHLQAGLKLTGKIDPQQHNPNGGGPRLIALDLIEGKDPALYKPRDFDSLTPIDPHVWLRLETGAQPLTTRVMDLLTPIGKGQRGLIVAPPRSGKTVLLQHIALAVAQNYPEMKIIVLLVDERPEEVTDMKRTVKGDVFASSSDQDSEQHVRLAEIVFERAKRLAEQGEEVFLLLDSLTRLARAYNKEVGTSGRTMTGGIDVHALEIPKRLFGAARVFEEGGSLTILGTSLVETGSKMDDIIFQEFKGTGNMELVLDRKLADRRIYPAIDIPQSGTRKEEKLLPKDSLRFITLMRRVLAGMKPIEAMTLLVDKLSLTKTNDEFMDQVRTKW
jgi:transcription termination factor Rho